MGSSKIKTENWKLNPSYTFVCPFFITCFFVCLFLRFICKTTEILVPLQCQMKEIAEAAIKDKNCEH